MNATVCNRNSENTDILKRLSDLERLGTCRNGYLNSRDEEVLKQFENSIKPFEYNY